MAAAAEAQEPDVQFGLEYWKAQSADYDGVLGGFGTGSLPRVESMGSRRFLLQLIPSLCTVPSALSPKRRSSSSPAENPRTRALDVGAGVGRVTADVLLHLVSDVVLLEPVEKFVQEAWKRGLASVNISGDAPPSGERSRWKGLGDGSKSVTFLQGTLQAFDPAHPLVPSSTTLIGHLGYTSGEDDSETGFDVIWCQWCLGHLSDADLRAFFQRSLKALRKREDGKSVIVVKENVCNNDEGSPRTEFDPVDSSLTRSDLAWKKLFKEAGLRLVRERVQNGLACDLFKVKMYALRRA